jgi:hypothetical protein
MNFPITLVRSVDMPFQQYAEFCQDKDFGPMFHPEILEYFLTVMKLKPRIIGKVSKNGELISAFPVLFKTIFPSVIHKRILSPRMRFGIGQPEAFFPITNTKNKIRLGYISFLTNYNLQSKIRVLGKRSIRNMAIAKARKHKKLTRRKNIFLQQGGEVHFAETIDPADFADIYTKLYCSRWDISIDNMGYIKDQIKKTYKHIYGLVLIKDSEPVACQFCYRYIGNSIYFIDYINSGVKITRDNDLSYGSIMLLLSLRRAEDEALSFGKTLRYSFGYHYGKNTYKDIWTDPEPTFTGY